MADGFFGRATMCSGLGDQLCTSPPKGFWATNNVLGTNYDYTPVDQKGFGRPTMCWGLITISHQSTKILQVAHSDGI